MPDLIRQGRVYIAQPPLYKISYKGVRPKKAEGDGAEVSADAGAEEGDEEAEAPAAKGKKGAKPQKKRELYITNDAEFDRIMVEQGLDGAQLELRAPDGKAQRTLSTAEVKRLSELMADMVKLGKEIEKLGLEFGKYLGRRNKEGLLPLAKVLLRGTKSAPAVYTEAELDQVVAKAREAGNRIWLHTDPLGDREGADVEITRFTGKVRLEQVLRDLEKLGVSWELFSPRPRADHDADGFEPRFALQREKDKEPLRFDGLRELPEAIKKLGARGIQIQRYKGLGEMDKEELEETTMDPARRTLLRVTLEDMAEANRIFNILMGTKVEPRRDYIEAHAAEARNLDV
ncbi:MAG: hypothetical protein KF878_12170 [Planctomycetes bacterium]|nr:hypothetical protein [Planctomycetota bacterium]